MQLSRPEKVSKVAIFAIPRFFFIEKSDKWSITRQPRRVRPSYRTQMKALFTGFHLPCRLSLCLKYSWRYGRQSSVLGGQGLETRAITQLQRRVRPSYMAQMKALSMGFHLLYRLSQCSKYSLRYGRQSSVLGGQGQVGRGCGGDGAAGRPATERAQGTSSPWLLGAAPAARRRSGHRAPAARSGAAAARSAAPPGSTAEGGTPRRAAPRTPHTSTDAA